MSKGLIRKVLCMVVIEVLCIVLLGIFLTVMQTRLSVNNQHENTMEKLQQMQAVIDSADEKAQQNEDSYDEVYRSKAASVAYMANNDANFTYTDEQLKSLADIMNVTNILIIDREGNQIAKAKETPANFTYSRYNQLRMVFSTGEPSEAFEVTIGENTRRYYGAVIDEDREAVIEHDPEELDQIQANTSSWKSILSNVNVGLEGYTFAVSSQDYTFLYHPDEDLIGKDSLDAGLDTEELEDNNFAWMTLNGESLYCGVKNIDADNAYVICAVPREEIISSRNITVGIVLFVFFIVITTVVVYGILVLLEQERRGHYNPEDYKAFGKLYYNKSVGRRMLRLSIVGLLVIFLASFYMQTLFSLSQRSMSNNRQVEEVGETIDKNKEEVALITSQYNRRYLNKGQVASYILSQNRNLWTKADLEEMSRALGVEFILLFDKEGKEIISNSSYVNFQISNNPEEQSYEFNKLLQGVEYVIQDAQPDEVSGEFHQYIGVTMYDSNGDPDGFLQISIVPDKLEEALAATTLSSVLSSVKASAGGFAFAVEKEGKTFSYYPEERMNGKNAAEYGMTNNQFRDEYCDYITINNQKYYGSSLETDDNYIYIAAPESRITGTRLPVALASASASLICLLLSLLILSVSRVGEVSENQEGEEDVDNGPMINVMMPDGTIRKTESAASRWSNNVIKWGDETPEQRIISILKGLLSIFALAICLGILFKDSFFDQDSIFVHIISGNWERNVNIFAITACIMIICVACVIVIVLRKILRVLSKTFGARGETICRLLRSFIKYVSVITVLYYCFALFGVDTQTLLASAGILSLVIGLGAKTLISDILAGLFIIFEGEFQVGDIVTVGDWRGTVQEIGVRTTKVVDAGDNVKIISNSEVSGVINMTKRNSFCVCDIGIEYGESLERVETILERELPNVKKRIPAVKGGPFYKGVVSLGDNSVNIRIVAQCEEADRVQLGRDLNREMKLIFDEHDINIPFPQIVLNQPKEYQKATEWEKMQADEFNEAQRKLSKGMGNENEAEDR